MNQIIITHKDGTTLPLFSRERVSAVSKATQKVALLSDDVVTLTVTSATPLDLQIGDTATIYGRTYKLNQLPEPTKDGSRKLSYEIRLEGLQYELIDVHYHLPEDAYGETFYADLAEHLRVLMWNVARIYPGKWQLGECPTNTEYKNITNSEKNCLQALQELCEQYDVEFAVSTDGTTNTLDVKTQVGETHAFTLQFGRGKGLYQLSRKNVNNAGVTTRVYFYGGSDNLGSGYGHTKLCLPGTTRLTSYLEDKAAIAKYGIKEGEKDYSDIIPQYKSKVTGLGADVNVFVDTAMFDLNEKKNGNTVYLIEGTSAKVKFETGQLAGYSFDVHSYDHSSHTFVINKFTDENGLVLPNSGSEGSAAFQINEGDEYTLYDIIPPESKLREAESKLLTKAEAYLPTVSQPQVSYGLSLTEGFFIALWGREVDTEVLHVGDYIHVVDTQIGVDKEVRITEISRNVLKKHSYDITLSDTITKSTTVRVLNDLQSINETITQNGLADPTKARRRWKATQELLSMVFDPDGDYYSEKIKPLSVETSMLAVGAKSQQFTLLNVTLQPNYEGNENIIYISGGTLAHYAISDDGVRYWTMNSMTTATLTSYKPYYIYAKCSRTDSTGVWVLSTEAITVDSNASYYYFLVGVLNSVTTDDDGSRPARLLSLTYGSSTINGRFVKTGRIESNAGTCYFDLDNNEIGGVIKFVSTDGTTQDVADVADKADEAKDYINNTLPGVISNLQSQLDGQIEQFFYEEDPYPDVAAYDTTLFNEPYSTWYAELDEDSTAISKHLGDLYYNTESGKVFRLVEVSYRPKPGAALGKRIIWVQLTDEELAQALTLAQSAYDLADNKRRIFTTTPYPPYDVGDLWTNGTNLYVCKIARETGSYTSGDWKLATDYTNDDSLNAFIENDYADDYEAIKTQIDGKIESWFTSSDPSTAWTTAALKAAHVGDMWYNGTTGSCALKRYSYVDSAYTWVAIQDQTAIDAYKAASTAQDTADGKRTVFVEQPTVPYYEGDLWIREYTKNSVTKKELWRCVTPRKTGSFDINEWAHAVYYDNTQTVIDGGIVTAGTVQLVSPLGESIVAGITGGEDETTSTTSGNKVRFWAGASKENRYTAPFRVLQDGSFVATKATITGDITATSGTFTGTIYATDGEFNGSINIANGAIKLNKDGSGSLANGGITWQKDYGVITVSTLQVGSIWGFNQHVAMATSTNAVGRTTAMTYLTLPTKETVSLPSDPLIAFPYTIINRSKYVKTLSAGTKTIYNKSSSGTTLSLAAYGSVTLMFDGSWFVISKYE